MECFVTQPCHTMGQNTLAFPTEQKQYHQTWSTEAVALRLEATIQGRLEAVASRVEAIALRLEAAPSLQVWTHLPLPALPFGHRSLPPSLRRLVGLIFFAMGDELTRVESRLSRESSRFGRSPTGDGSTFWRSA